MLTTALIRDVASSTKTPGSAALAFHWEIDSASTFKIRRDVVMVSMGSEVVATITGSTVKTVCCENCKQEYRYRLSREGSGEGFKWFFIGQESARADATKRAGRDLRRQLERDADLVPCPGCGHCQSEMVNATREKRHGWMTGLALFAGLGFIYALPLSMANQKLDPQELMIARMLAGGTGLVAFGAALLQAYLRRLYNPNALPVAELLEIARIRCINDDRLPSTSLSDDESSRADFVQGVERTEEQVESVSEADRHTGLLFFFFALCCGAIALILLEKLPEDQQWRSLAAIGLSIVFVLFGVKFLTRKT